jgi:mannosylglycerate hydrolase MGH1-like protein
MDTTEPADGESLPDDAALAAQARDVLDGNWTGHSTIPAPGLYPHQWNWDTGFIAMGRSTYDQTRAETELLHLFEGQWRTGMVPHIVFNPEVARDAYFPGPDFWRSPDVDDAPRGVETSGLTQPPVHGFAALEMHRRSGDAEQSAAFLRRLFPGLAAQHRYFRDRRSADGLTYTLHPWETGLDNSPAWDEAFEGFEIPPGALPPYERRDLAHSDPRDRPTNDAYDRFVYLAVVYREAGYDDAVVRDRTPFLVADPMFNAIWAWSAASVAEIADVIGEDGAEFREDAERITRAIETKLWSAEDGRFFPLDVQDGAHMDHHSIVSFMPLAAPGLDAEIAKRTVHELRGVRRCTHETLGRTCFVMPSFPPRDPGFDPRKYWRGPIWINTNWLLERGCRAVGADSLADELRTSTLELVRRNGFREYFDTHTGAAYGGHRFSWSAALTLDILAS